MATTTSKRKSPPPSDQYLQWAFAQCYRATNFNFSKALRKFRSLSEADLSKLKNKTTARKVFGAQPLPDLPTGSSNGGELYNFGPEKYILATQAAATENQAGIPTSTPPTAPAAKLGDVTAACHDTLRTFKTGPESWRLGYDFNPWKALKAEDQVAKEKATYESYVIKVAPGEHFFCSTPYSVRFDHIEIVEGDVVLHNDGLLDLQPKVFNLTRFLDLKFKREGASNQATSNLNATSGSEQPTPASAYKIQHSSSTYVNQIGGQHYQTVDGIPQVWDLAAMLSWDPYTFTAIKYLWRWPAKNGVEDLKKVLSYVEKTIKHLEAGNLVINEGFAVGKTLNATLLENK